MRWSVLFLLLSFSSTGLAMDDRGEHGVQLELCPERRAYIQAKRVECSFCDAESMKSNLVLYEKQKKDYRVIMNKHPYFSPDRGQHFLIMPISHQTRFGDVPSNKLMFQVAAMQKLVRRFGHSAYAQEIFINDEPGGGQSVPHVHMHCKNYVLPPCSLPEMLAQKSAETTITVQESFEAARALLSQPYIAPSQEAQEQSACQGCLSCSVVNNKEMDQQNLVFFRGKYNVACMSHYPTLPGEVSIIPLDHVSSVKDLSLEAFTENLILAIILLPRQKAYAGEFVRQCNGGNIYMKSVGRMAPDQQKKGRHVHTVSMPRTIIVATPGTLDAHSCKLDMDAQNFFDYLKGLRGELEHLLH